MAGSPSAAVFRRPLSITPASVIVVCVAALVSLGLVVLFSASSPLKGGPYAFLWKQLIFLAGAIGAGWLVAIADLEQLRRFAWVVAGISLAAVYAGNGWIGQFLEPLGLKVAFTPLGVLVALTFIGLPFVVRTVQPVLEDFEREQEEAAACLGASRWLTFRRVVLPAALPALLTGFALAFARALGEYGSVIFIAGNVPMKSEITSLLIITKLEQYDYAGATALAVVMLCASFVMLLVINSLQWYLQRRTSRGASSSAPADATLDAVAGGAQ